MKEKIETIELVPNKKKSPLYESSFESCPFLIYQLTALIFIHPKIKGTPSLKYYSIHL